MKMWHLVFFQLTLTSCRYLLIKFESLLKKWPSVSASLSQFVLSSDIFCLTYLLHLIRMQQPVHHTSHMTAGRRRRAIIQGVFNWCPMSSTTVGTTFYRSVFRKCRRPEGIYSTSEKVNIINIFHLTNIQLIFTNILQYL